MFKKFLSLSLIAISFAACTEDVMDDINKDEANPAVDIVDAKFQITDAIMSTAYSTYGGAYAWYVSSYTEQVFGTGDNQLRKAELRNSNETAASTTFNNEWNATYTNLMNIKQILDKTGKGKINEGHNDVAGIANVLWVLNFEALTDLHGDIPYSQALQGLDNMQPDLDSQLDIYADLLKRIEDAIKAFDMAIANEESNVGSQDILYGGDCEKWKALAYAVKARLLLNQSAVKADYDGVIEAAQAAVDNGFSPFAISAFNGVDCDNPWSAYFWSRYYVGSCKTVVDLMNERADSRGSYNLPLFGKNVVGEPGNEEHARAIRTLNCPGWMNNGAQVQNVFSTHELYFILAEAKARKNIDATAEFEKAITDAFNDWADADPYGYTNADDAADYIASLGTPTLKEIMIQKYIASARDEQIQTYNDIRRCKALGEEFITLTNPKNIQGGANRWPLRLPYGNSDVISNPKVAAAFGTGADAGVYIFTEKCRIYGGSR